MKIRAITAFIPLSWPLEEESLAHIGRFLADARLRFQQTGLKVQTIRLATPPFLDIVGDPTDAVLLEFAQTLEAETARHNIDFVSIGPVIAITPLALLMPIYALPQIIAETERIFSGVLFADEKNGVNLSAAQAFAQTVYKVAHTTPNGFGNLRLAALANVPPGVPFFPASYHHGGPASFAIATESADLALTAFEGAANLKEAQTRLTAAIRSRSEQIITLAGKIAEDHKLSFKGIDFSLAPYPDQAVSIGAAIERLGIEAFGGHGSLFATAFLTNCIQQANIAQIGFSGVMLPVLEDKTLAERAATGHFTVNDLLLYSAVCGTGLDTVPIPGHTAPEKIAALFLDMAALSVSLDKPLTARLMPIPGLVAGQEVAFDFEYFAPSRVLPVKDVETAELFERNSFIKLASSVRRKKRDSNIYPQSER